MWQALAVSLVLLVAVDSAADGPVPPAADGPVPPASVVAEDPCQRAARDLAEGEQHFKNGAFAKAIVALERALSSCDKPVLHYNLGRAHEGEGNLAEAIVAYEAYLRVAPEADDRGGIEQRIVTMKRELSLRGASEGPAVIPWVLAGVGVATLGVAAALGGAALTKQAAAEDAATHAAGVDIANSGEVLATASNVTFVVGGVLGAAGLVWGIVDLSVARAPQEASPVVISMHVGWASLSLRAVF